MAVLFQVGAVLALLVLTAITGGVIQRRHLAELARREAAGADLLGTNLKSFPGALPEGGELLIGSVVIGVDHFRNFIAALNNLFGGRVRTYERALERARREAIARLRDRVRSAGYNAVGNVRLETAILGPGKVEAIAYGTGYRAAT